MELAYSSDPIKGLLVIDGENLCMPTSFIDAILQLQDKQITIDEALLTETIQGHWPEADKIGNFFVTMLNSSIGAILIKNFLPPTYGTNNCKLIFQSFISRLGTPLHHQKDVSSIVWDIQPRKEDKEGFKTFSEHNNEVPLHTDSQYSNMPEKYMALYTYHQARCGGGKTMFLNGHTLLTSLISHAEGRKIVENLSMNKLPFFIPPVFSQQETPSFVSAPIFSPRVLIRYRKDTLQKGLELCNKYKVSQDVVTSLDQLSQIIQNSSDIQEFRLDDGDLILLNNHTALHARNEFKDLDRLLFRIRFND